MRAATPLFPISACTWSSRRHLVLTCSPCRYNTFAQGHLVKLDTMTDIEFGNPARKEAVEALHARVACCNCKTGCGGGRQCECAASGQPCHPHTCGCGGKCSNPVNGHIKLVDESGADTVLRPAWSMKRSHLGGRTSNYQYIQGIIQMVGGYLPDALPKWKAGSIGNKCVHIEDINPACVVAGGSRRAEQLGEVVKEQSLLFLMKVGDLAREYELRKSNNTLGDVMPAGGTLEEKRKRGVRNMVTRVREGLEGGAPMDVTSLLDRLSSDTLMIKDAKIDDLHTLLKLAGSGYRVEALDGQPVNQEQMLDKIRRVEAALPSKDKMFDLAVQAYWGGLPVGTRKRPAVLTDALLEDKTTAERFRKRGRDQDANAAMREVRAAMMAGMRAANVPGIPDSAQGGAFGRSIDSMIYRIATLHEYVVEQQALGLPAGSLDGDRSGRGCKTEPLTNVILGATADKDLTSGSYRDCRTALYNCAEAAGVQDRVFPSGLPADLAQEHAYDPAQNDNVPLKKLMHAYSFSLEPEAPSLPGKAYKTWASLNVDVMSDAEDTDDEAPVAEESQASSGGGGGRSDGSGGGNGSSMW